LRSKQYFADLEASAERAVRIFKFPLLYNLEYEQTACSGYHNLQLDDRLLFSGWLCNGLPDGMCSVRRGDGRWAVADTRSGRAMESRGFGSRKAAEESALAFWDAMDDDRRANALHVIANHATADTAAAQVAYCRAVGIEDPAQPQEQSPESPEAQEPAPMSDCMNDIVAAAAEPVPDMPEPATDASEPARYRFCVHLLTAATPTSAGGHRLYSAQYVCAGPGLTAADITGANAMLREAATARGQRVVMQGFGNYEARSWCELDPASPVNNPPPVAASEPATLPDAPGAIDCACMTDHHFEE
jgi:hypothetical protein